MQPEHVNDLQRTPPGNYSDDAGLSQISPHLQFLTILRDAGFSPAEIEFIDRAYDIAKRAHSEASREGGDRYFEHCRAVALILVQEIGIRDFSIITAALLHDTVEDTSIFGSLAIHGISHVRTVAYERISNFFNSDVADFVLAVTKTHKTGDYATDQQNKEGYFMVLKTAPVGALFVKMADRLHNLRSVESRPMNKQREQFEETALVLIPVFEAGAERAWGDARAFNQLLNLVKLENEILGEKILAI